MESVYEESCYEIFMSSYKNQNNNDDITDVSDLTYDEMCINLDRNK